MLRLYKSFILPHLEYCSPLLLEVGRVQVNRLEDANYYILRSLLDYCKSILYEELLRSISMETLEHSRKSNFWSCCIDVLIITVRSTYIKDFFSVRKTQYNRRGSGVNLCAPQLILKSMKKSFTYICAQLWNSGETGQRCCPFQEWTEKIRLLTFCALYPTSILFVFFYFIIFFNFTVCRDDCSCWRLVNSYLGFCS